jgi:hypothetical protein
MGSWWKDIPDNDLVPVVRGTFREYLRQGLTCEQAAERVFERYGESLDNKADQHLISMVVAELQWKYGDLDHDLFHRVQNLIETDTDMSVWKGVSDKVAYERHKILKEFVARLRSPHPRPLKIPEVVLNEPPFKPGDCLSVALPNGQFGAAIVLAADKSNPGLSRNLIGVLNYLSTREPSLEVFNQRRWLRVPDDRGRLHPDLCWFGPGRFRSEEHRFRVVGQIKLKRSDPMESNRHAGWTFLGQSAISLGGSSGGNR